MNAIRDHVPTNITILLDLGAGNAGFGERFTCKNRRRAISVDTIPAWKRRGTTSTRHTKNKADALTFRLPTDVDPKRVIGGFNPPDGHTNILAKKFVRRAYDMECAYGIWLVPQLLKGYLAHFYHILYQKDYHRLNLFRSHRTKTRSPNHNGSALFWRRRSKPAAKMNAIPPSLVSGGFTSRAFVPNKTTLIVRILGGKVRFMFARSGKKWIMYNYENDRKGNFTKCKRLSNAKCNLFLGRTKRPTTTCNWWEACGHDHSVWHILCGGWKRLC